MEEGVDSGREPCLQSINVNSVADERGHEKWLFALFNEHVDTIHCHWRMMHANCNHVKYHFVKST